MSSCAANSRPSLPIVTVTMGEGVRFGFEASCCVSVLDREEDVVLEASRSVSDRCSLDNLVGSRVDAAFVPFFSLACLSTLYCESMVAELACWLLLLDLEDLKARLNMVAVVTYQAGL